MGIQLIEVHRGVAGQPVMQAFLNLHKADLAVHQEAPLRHEREEEGCSDLRPPHSALEHVRLVGEVVCPGHPIHFRPRVGLLGVNREDPARDQREQAGNPSQAGEPPFPQVAGIAETLWTSTLRPPHGARLLPRGKPCPSPSPCEAPEVASDVGWILDARRVSPEAGSDRAHANVFGGWRGLQAGSGVLHHSLGNPLRDGFSVPMPNLKCIHGPSGSDRRGPPDSAQCAHRVGRTAGPDESRSVLSAETRHSAGGFRIGRPWNEIPDGCHPCSRSAPASAGRAAGLVL